MILNALEHLSSTETRSVSPSDSLSHALHFFISEHLTATPPSTPLDEGDEEHAMSSSDLIGVLTATLNAHIDGGGGGGGGGGGSEGGSNVPSVPVGSPQEGLSELVRLGIHPEDILQALNSLSIQNKAGGGEGEEVVDTNDDEYSDPLLDTITMDTVITGKEENPDTET